MRYVYSLLLFLCASATAQVPYVLNCGTNTACACTNSSCTTAGPSLTGTGDTGSVFGAKINANFANALGPLAQTSAEVAAGVTPVNYAYAPGDVRRYGALCNGSTNDSTAIQNAEIVAETGTVAVSFPAATCVATSITIQKPTVWIGAGTDKTYISNPSGSTTAIATVSISSSNWSPGTGEPAQITMRDFTFYSPNRSSGSGDALHLIAPSNPYSATRVMIDRVSIEGVAGNGINADCSGAGGCWPGWVEAVHLLIQYIGGIGITANSTADWFIYLSTVAGANGAEGILISGCTNMHFKGVSLYVNNDDFLDFQSNLTVIEDSIIDETAHNGLNVTLTSGQTLTVANTIFRWSSTATNATYSDLNIQTANAGNIYLQGNHWLAPSSSPSSNKPQYNVNFNSSTVPAYFLTSKFDLGNPPTAGVSNNYPLMSGWFQTSSGSMIQYGGQAVVNSNTANQGFLVQNSGGSIASLSGSSTNNAVPVLTFLGNSFLSGVTSTGPAVSSGGGTSPTVTSGVSGNTFLVTEGSTGSPSTTLVITMPFTAPNGWNCGTPLDQTSSTITARQSNNSATGATITFSSAPANSDKILFNCEPY